MDPLPGSIRVQFNWKKKINYLIFVLIAKTSLISEIKLPLVIAFLPALPNLSENKFSYL